MGLEHDPVARPTTPEQARAAVRCQHQAGVDVIKLWVDDLGGRFPMMSAPIYRAVIDEAHQHGLKVAAHIHDQQPAADLVEAGIDIIAHGIRDQPQAGVRIGFGTDAGAMPQRVIGFAEHRELELMTQAGFSPAQALRVATADAAELQGLSDRGRIAPGAARRPAGTRRQPT